MVREFTLGLWNQRLETFSSPSLDPALVVSLPLASSRPPVQLQCWVKP